MVVVSPSQSSVVVLFGFVQHDINNEDGAKHECLFLHVHVDWEGHAKVVGIREHLFQQARPLLADFAHLRAVLLVFDHEVNVVSTADGLAGAARSLDLSDQIFVGIEDSKQRGAAERQVADVPQHLSVPVLYLGVVTTALTGTAETPSAALKVATNSEHLLLSVVSDMIDKTTLGTTAHSLTYVRLFQGIVDLLTHAVHDPELVLALPARQNFQQVGFLLHQQLIQLCEVFHPGGTSCNGGRRWHPHHLSRHGLTRLSRLSHDRGWLDSVARRINAVAWLLWSSIASLRLHAVALRLHAVALRLSAIALRGRLLLHSVALGSGGAVAVGTGNVVVVNLGYCLLVEIFPKLLPIS